MHFTDIRKQSGSVLLMALVFLVLTAMIAVTIMDTSVLEIKMAANQQFREEAAQHAEGIVGEVAGNYEDQMTPSVQVGTIFCDVSESCDQNTLSISSDLKSKIPVGVNLSYQAEKTGEDPAPGGEGNYTDYFFEMSVDYDGVNKGLSSSNIAVGLKQRAIESSRKTANGWAMYR